MFLAYDGIVFDMLFLDGWQIDADLSSDGADFLRWHHTIDVTCILNQEATAAYKFPTQSLFADAVNQQRAQEAANRLKAKQQLQNTIKNKSGQLPGENKLKSAGQIIDDFIRRITMGFIDPGLRNIKVLPSGKVIYAPPTPPANATSAGVPTSYDTWNKVTNQVQFEQNLAQQQGSTYVTPTGGPVDSTPANVSPSSTLGSLIEGITSIAKNPLNIKQAIGNFAQAAIFGASLGGQAAAAGLAASLNFAGGNIGVGDWWKGIQQQLEEIGAQLGITKDDIFGPGRQPIQNLKFLTPPPKRDLNVPPPEINAGGVTGWTVPVTFQELQNRLNKKGRPLAIWLNSGPGGTPEYMLVSPYVGFTTDALTGPVCRMQHIPAIHGNVTGILKLRFETWVAPPPQIVFGSDLVTAPNVSGVTNDTVLRAKQTLNAILKQMGVNPGGAGAGQGGANTSQPQNVTNMTSLLAGGAVQAVPNLSASSGISLLTGAAASVANPGGGNRAGTIVNNAIRNAGKGNSISIAGNRLFLAIPPLISNRWTMRQSPDAATQLNTTIIEGTAHFRLDVLQALQMTPDQLRPFFMHPIPFGYVRMPPEVTVLSDGASVQYQIVDIQQMMNNPGGAIWGVHSVKAQQTMRYHSPIDYVRSPFAPDISPFGGIIGAKQQIPMKFKVG